MHRNPFIRFTMLCAASVCAAYAAAALADEPPSYKADPSVYKLLSENDQFRVILATRKPGQKDAWHGHESPQVVYALTDCTTRLYQPDGKFTEREAHKGDVNFGPASASHAAENRGSGVCQQLIVERK